MRATGRILISFYKQAGDTVAMARKPKKQTFSVTKAVKSNARDRVGQPKPSRVLPDETKQTRRERKHKKGLQDLIAKEE
jgi:hypothetical protein